MINRLATIAIASFVVISIADAQSAVPATKSLCWRAQPLPDCRGWLVTEFGYDYGVVTTRQRSGEHDFQHRVSFSIGRMWNVSPSTANGITASSGFAKGGLLFRGELRRRYWRDSTVGFDLSAGLATQSVPQRFGGNPPRAAGITAGAAAEYDWLALTARGDLMRSADDRTVSGLALGVRAGSRSGTIGFALYAAAVLGIVVLIATAE